VPEPLLPTAPSPLFSLFKLSHRTWCRYQRNHLHPPKGRGEGFLYGPNSRYDDRVSLSGLRYRSLGPSGNYGPPARQFWGL